MSGKDIHLMEPVVEVPEKVKGKEPILRHSEREETETVESPHKEESMDAGVQTEKAKREAAKNKLLSPVAYKHYDTSKIMDKVWGTQINLTLEELAGVSQSIQQSLKQGVTNRTYPVEALPERSTMFKTSAITREDMTVLENPTVVETETETGKQEFGPFSSRMATWLGQMDAKPWEVRLLTSSVPKAKVRLNGVECQALLDK